MARSLGLSFNEKKYSRLQHWQYARKSKIHLTMWSDEYMLLCVREFSSLYNLHSVVDWQLYCR